jgi:UDP-glucose 4-epimerase
VRVLVTGGAGFIGANLVRALLKGGHEAGVVDDLSSGKREQVPDGVWFRRLDILAPALRDAFDEFRPEAVVHLAAQPSVSASFADPERNHAVNVDGTRRVASAALGCRARRVISASSAAVYGEPAELPLPEQAAKSPANPYGDSKLAAELALIEELGASETDFASFRFSNVYGPMQDAHGEGGVVAIFADRLAAGLPPRIYGDGKQTRDFVYVCDLATAVVDALLTRERLAIEGLDGPAYNISTGEEVSVLDLAERMSLAAGRSAGHESAPAREGDVVRSALDPRKAHEVFGWRARTPLDQGLERTTAWFAARR